MLLFLNVLFPVIMGAILPLFRMKSRTLRSVYVMLVTCITSVLAFYNVFSSPSDTAFVFLHLTEKAVCMLQLDDMGRLFTGLIAFLWPMAVLYSLEYMEHEGGENSFFAWYTMTYGITLGIAMSGDLITLYVFYELLTLATLPLVMHRLINGRAAAGLKYLYYSLLGAALAFAGIMLVFFNGDSTSFTYGGVLTGLADEQKPLLRFGYLLAFLGMGVKAAVFPLHDWLPSVSVAPTPVTALLHAVAVVKAGAIAVIRVTFYAFGPALIAGTWAQALPFCLAAFTVVFGSAMAVKEKHFKRRLAYSTVSNLSYIVMGALLLTPEGLDGALNHLIFHALMKITLFCACGAIMTQTDREYVSELHGLGHAMPVTFVTLTVAAVSLVGIPPFIGFISKWKLAQAGVMAGDFYSIVAPAALVLSAILTAIYLFIPVAYAWFPAKDIPESKPAGSLDPTWKMKLPLIIWCAAILVLSVYSSPLQSFISEIARGAM